MKTRIFAEEVGKNFKDELLINIIQNIELVHSTFLK